MDLVAYRQIEDLCGLAELNGIGVPRLRGYRLMGDQTPWTEAEMEREKREFRESCLRDIEWSASRIWEESLWRREDNIAVARVDIRYENERIADELDRMRSFDRDFDAQCGMWNRYVGREDVLYIHARQGRGNWSDTTWRSFRSKEWFLDAIDDAYDHTYCDIFARVTKWPEPKEEKKEE